MPSDPLTVKTESYIGETPTSRFNFSICCENSSASAFADTVHVHFMTSAINGFANDESKIRSSLRPSGLGFSDSCSHICNASITLFMNFGTFNELGLVLGLMSFILCKPSYCALFDSQLQRNRIGITLRGALMSGRLIRINLPFLSPFSHNWSMTPILWT